MSLDAVDLFALLPAVYRTRDACIGGPLQALYEVVTTQAAIVEDNIEQLYDDQFIETCAPWVIPYIGDLIGYNSIYQTSVGIDSRAEVANTIGYRRRKGTPIALQQVAMDVSGRAAVVVEEFRRLITTQSMRDPRPHHAANIDLRRNAVLDNLDDSAFDVSNRTLDVRRIAPRIRAVADPDPAPLDIALHGPGRFNVPDIAVHLWRCRAWEIAQAPAFVVDARRFKFNPIGLDIPLFSQPQANPPPFTSMNTRLDVPQPIQRGEFARQLTEFYGQSMQLYADGAPIVASQICCANLADRAGGSWCTVLAGKIAIDPQLGRIQFAADLTPPQSLRVTYNYGFPAPIGGGPYDRTGNLDLEVPTQDTSQADFFALVGTADFPDLQTAIAQWNLQPAGTTGIIVLPGFERYVIDLTGANAVTLASESTLALVAAVPVPLGGPRDVTWDNACVTLLGNVEITGLPPPMPEGEVAPAGQLILNGLLIEGQLSIDGSTVVVQLSDSTLVPGLGAANPGLSPCEPSIIIQNDATLCMARCISGPIAASAAGSVRVCNSIIDANSPCCVAYAGADGYSAGADLHVEDSTIVGKVRTRTMRLASDSIFFARLGRHDPWPAALWCSRRQAGCIRFCSLPREAITPRCYECLPPNADSASMFAPSFISLRYGQPAYGLLSGDVPMAVWHGADSGSQMGVYGQIQETEAVSNVQIRTPEYLPVLLESGIFLHPSRPQPRPAPPPFVYHGSPQSCCGEDDDELAGVPGIGVGLL